MPLPVNDVANTRYAVCPPMLPASAKGIAFFLFYFFYFHFALIVALSRFLVALLTREWK